MADPSNHKQWHNYTPPDVETLLGWLRGDPGPVAEALRSWLDLREEVVIARAPGRLDVMGGIADYSGSLVLQLPIQEATLAAVQRTSDPSIRIVSCPAEGEPIRSCEAPLQALVDGEASTYNLCRAFFERDAETRWAAYVAGALLVLIREKGLRVEGGLRIAIVSRVPEGKGVASSAALEVAAMTAIAELCQVSLEPVELALLCQKVENLVVGAPCGVMDQTAAACGRAGRLLALLCQPAELVGHVEIPEGIAFWGIDSGIRHAVSGSDYTSVRVGAFMGYRILADLAGLDARPDDEADTVNVVDGRWGGYLANLTPSEFEHKFAGRLPKSIGGQDFLDRYQGTTDPVARIDPARTYAVRQPTRHPIYENFRVRTFGELLRGTPSESTLRLLGELMYQSHQSYSACGLGSDGTDRLVEMVRKTGPAVGLFGAKITGGGSGGTVAVLGWADADGEVRRIARQYAEQTGRQTYVFSGSSDGAVATGCFRFPPR